jgi:hypothetical protein
MIHLDERLFTALDAAARDTTRLDLHALGAALQTALELEHATIPPYLLAAYSLKAANHKIRLLILDVAREEMLHMMLVANLMNAIGAPPSFKHPGFVPNYPTTLPGAVQKGLTVPLEPFSLPLLETVFLQIEEPEHPQAFPEAGLETEEAPRTIGQFYAHLQDVIRKAGNDIFVGDPVLQVETAVDDDDSIVVVDVDSAVRAINLIVGQGEGTPTTPFDEAGHEPAHFYRFQQILKQKTLRPDPSVPEKFSFGPPAIPFDPTGVFPVKPNLKMADLPVDSQARMLVEQFNREYTQMLFHLHDAFNGKLDEMNSAVNIMEERLKPLAKQLVQIDIGGAHAGPTFEFLAP